MIESQNNKYIKVKSTEQNLNNVNNPTNNYITHGNVKNMKIKDVIKYDNRPLSIFLKDNFTIRYKPISTFYHNSIYRPRILKYFVFVFSVSLNFIMNSIFYTDDLIYKRYNISVKNEFNIVIEFNIDFIFIFFDF